MSKKSANHTNSPVSSSDDNIQNFRHLSYELLKYSTQGLLRKDFLPKVSEMIREHFNCDVVEIWVKEGSDKHFRCVVTHTTRMPYGFILVPCPLGEVTDLPPDDPNELSMEQFCCYIIKGMIDTTHPRVTRRGSFWAGDTEEEILNEELMQVPLPSSTIRLPIPYKSIATIPIKLEQECSGLLQLKSRQRKFFSRRSVEFLEDISTVLGVALSYQYSQIELRERIKEITCLYGIARVIAQPEASFDEIIQRILNLLPPAWLFPEITCARIVLDGREYTTKEFKESPYRQVSDIIVDKSKVGFVEVVYLENKLTLDEGPFLIEERNLIDSIAQEVAVFYERSKAEAEKASLQEQLRHADRLATIGQLAAGVAHELNEPLGNILGFAQLAKKYPKLPSQVTKDLQHIEAASLNAREIIKKLMTFARQLPPRKMPVNINDVISEGLSFFEMRCVKTGIQTVCLLADGLPKITIDPGQINQVLVNLMVNAIQAMPNGGTLTVETFQSNESIHFSIEDTGTGIDDNMMNQIFIPFFTTKDINEGTGLGLAVVHGIITSHGGTISVESKLGKGTRFIICLPLTHQSE
jgi:two-component system NtrC family sensor kinase